MHKGAAPFVLSRQRLLIESEYDKASSFVRITSLDRVSEVLHAAREGSVQQGPPDLPSSGPCR